MLKVDELPLFKTISLSGSRSLVVVTDTPEVSGAWLAAGLLPADGLFAAFERKPVVAVPKTIDFSLKLYSLSGGSFQALPPHAMVAEILKHKPSVVTLEHPDFLIAAGTHAAPELVAAIHALLEHCTVLVVLQVNQTLAGPAYGANEVCRFVTNLLRQADLVLTLRPLSTGRADDVTGLLRVAAGQKALGQVEEAEYTYRIGRPVVITPRK